MSSRVKEIIGISELDLVQLDQKDHKQFILADATGSELCFINTETFNVTPIGSFKTLSVKALKELIEEIPYPHSKKSDKNKCRFIIKEGVDIGELQSTLKTHNKAMVQVASNFNCLEVPSRYCPPNTGYLVDKAHKDSTQGPAASFGPLPAYLFRAHFSIPNFQGQVGDQQLNLLEDVGKYFGEPQNGKLTLYGNEEPIRDGDTMEKVVDMIKVGLHSDVRVIFGRDSKKLNFCLEKPYPMIDQCFNSTINLMDFGRKVHPKQLTSITRALLRAAYESTYLSAIYKQRKVLYLTLIGGGCFHNPINMILEELVRAHKLWVSHPKSKLEQVYLCLYEKENKGIKAFLEKEL